MRHTPVATRAQYTVFKHESYGNYLCASEFGADSTGKTDSLAAIQAALAAASNEKAALYLEGDIYISAPITLDSRNDGVTALFGEGMNAKSRENGGKATTISFNTSQGDTNYRIDSRDSNELDVSPWAGIVVNAQNQLKIENLTIRYTRNDFYRPAESYFGKVNGIYVVDSSNIAIAQVEVTGANRAGIYFDSLRTLQKNPDSAKGSSYKASLINNEISENDPALPIGNNNSVRQSYLHHNRVAGVMIGFQRNFTAGNNDLEANGDSRDGGTGYGAATVAGSYNFGVRYARNRTKNNYRKGLDAHDGNDIVIEHNTLEGDYQTSIEVYNRQFTMDRVAIRHNTIIQNPANRIRQDDGNNGNPRPSVKWYANYQLYQTIAIQTNEKLRNLHSKRDGVYEISGNTIKNFTAYENSERESIQDEAILFRNHEPEINYTLTIDGNTIEGAFAGKSIIAARNDTMWNEYRFNPAKKAYELAQTHIGKGSGNIRITHNQIAIDKMQGEAPISVSEAKADGALRGSVLIAGNTFTIKETEAVRDAFLLSGNAQSYNVLDNTFNLLGDIGRCGGKPIAEVQGMAANRQQPAAKIENNRINAADLSKRPRAGWLATAGVRLIESGNALLPEGNELDNCRGGKYIPTSPPNTKGSLKQALRAGMRAASGVGALTGAAAALENAFNSEKENQAGENTRVAANHHTPAASAAKPQAALPAPASEPQQRQPENERGALRQNPNAAAFMPAAPHRKQSGLMLDTAHRFYPLGMLKSYVDDVARAGGTFLHLRLSDEQNYALESVTLGQLARQAKQNANGSYTNPATGKPFYSAAQIQELAQYAKQKGVELVPGINATAQMNAIRNLFAHKDPAQAGAVFDSNDTLHYETEAGQQFMQTLYGEAADMFADSGMHIHIGGDAFSGSVSRNAHYIAYLNRIVLHLKGKNRTVRVERCHSPRQSRPAGQQRGNHLPRQRRQPRNSRPER
ncbi:family 20 glycosylhydrolase [Kingella oralis]|uniref:family 20 glycosylhydrolase n=1 Tax=Kingella oralis TaxID=505 RepID=UPI0034E59604